MSWLLIVVQILFGIFAVGIFVEFTHGRDVRNLLGALIFGGAALVSYSLSAWWPLLVGFAVALLAKMLGLSPDNDHRPALRGF